MVNENCQKCGKTIDTEQESIIHLDGRMTPEEYRNNQPKKGKIICVNCWETSKDGEFANCCDVVEEVSLSQSTVKGPNGSPLKERQIIRVPGLYTPPRPKANEISNSNDRKPEKQVIQPSNKGNKKLWAGIIIGLLIGAVIGGIIIWWLLKVAEKAKKGK